MITEILEDLPVKLFVDNTNNIIITRTINGELHWYNWGINNFILPSERPYEEFLTVITNSIKFIKNNLTEINNILDEGSALEINIRSTNNLSTDINAKLRYFRKATLVLLNNILDLSNASCTINQTPSISVGCIVTNPVLFSRIPVLANRLNLKLFNDKYDFILKTISKKTQFQITPMDVNEPIRNIDFTYTEGPYGNFIALDVLGGGAYDYLNKSPTPTGWEVTNIFTKIKNTIEALTGDSSPNLEYYPIVGISEAANPILENYVADGTVYFEPIGEDNKFYGIFSKSSSEYYTDTIINTEKPKINIFDSIPLDQKVEYLYLFNYKDNLIPYLSPTGVLLPIKTDEWSLSFGNDIDCPTTSDFDGEDIDLMDTLSKMQFCTESKYQLPKNNKENNIKNFIKDNENFNFETQINVNQNLNDDLLFEIDALSVAPASPATHISANSSDDLKGQLIKNEILKNLYGKIMNLFLQISKVLIYGRNYIIYRCISSLLEDENPIPDIDGVKTGIIANLKDKITLIIENIISDMNLLFDNFYNIWEIPDILNKLDEEKSKIQDIKNHLEQLIDDVFQFDLGDTDYRLRKIQ